MNELQSKILEILKVFIKVCDKHNLKYYLKGGSVLGAIRHKGFIPWDDDADVMMPREDFEKLLKLQDEFAPYDYFVQHWKTDKKYLYGFAKIRDNKTTMIEKPFALMEINHGIWLDIFPLDGFDYKDELRPKRYAHKMRYIWVEMIGFCYLWSLRRKFHLRTFFLDLVLNLGALLWCWGNLFNYRNRWIDHWAKSIKYDEAKMVGSYFSYYFTHEAFPKEWLGEGILVPFEDTMVRVPSEWDKYLTLVFGDYMTPPPEDKRGTLHFLSGMSTTIGYKEFIDEHRYHKKPKSKENK